MRIKIKNAKNMNDLSNRRQCIINQKVIEFLEKNGYILNGLKKDPLMDLINRLHKDNLTVITDVKNENLNFNPINRKVNLAFDLNIYFRTYKNCVGGE